MTYRLLITDLDGTLLRADGQVHARDREAIRALRRGGVQVSIATGRMYSGTRHIAREIQVEGPVGCLDGAAIIDASTDDTIEARRLPLPASQSLMLALEAHQPISYVFADDQVFHDERGAPFLPYLRTWSTRVAALPHVPSHARWHEEESVHTVVALGSEAQVRAVASSVATEAELFTACFSLRRPEFHGVWGLVARHAQVSKATAVARIAEHHGVPLAETIVVGDWHNDLPMFEVAGRSFAMAQAPEDVKRAATDALSADSVRGGGIEEAGRLCGLL